MSQPSRDISDKDTKLLWGASGGICAFPDCRRHCVEQATHSDSAAVAGEIAHIVAHAKAGPRADPTFPSESTNKYENLILLCPTHHTIIDKQANSYTVAQLRQWKSAHELWFRGLIAAAMPQVSFAELETIVNAIIKKPLSQMSSLSLMPLQQKMTRNQLTKNFLMRTGLSGVDEVNSFVNVMAGWDPDFPQRLRAGFVAEYQHHWTSGLRGDDLFEELRSFATGARIDPTYQAAALAVLCYLFERCEVFESDTA